MILKKIKRIITKMTNKIKYRRIQCLEVDYIVNNSKKKSILEQINFNDKYTKLRFKHEDSILSILISECQKDEQKKK